MSDFLIGKYIHDQRLEKNLTQEDLCDEEIAVSTIHRIENGEEIPQYETIKAILERMNLEVPLNIRNVSDTEFENFCIQKEIDRKVENKNFDIEKLLLRFKNTLIQDDKSDMQYYYLRTGQFYKYFKNENETAKDFFIQGLNLTLKNYFTNFKIEKKLLTTKELFLLYEFSKNEYESEQKERGITGLYNLKNYFDTNSRNPLDKIKLYPLILDILIKNLFSIKDYEKIIIFCDEAIKYFIQESSCQSTEHFLKIKIKACNLSGNKKLEKITQKVLESLNQLPDNLKM